MQLIRTIGDPLAIDYAQKPIKSTYGKIYSQIKIIYNQQKMVKMMDSWVLWDIDYTELGGDYV